MLTSIRKIAYPELYFGFVAPIGADLSPTVKAFHRKLRQLGYMTVEIKVTNIFRVLEHYITPKEPLKHRPLYDHDRYRTYIAYGDQLRAHFDDKALLAGTAVAEIMKRRSRSQGGDPKQYFSRTAFLVHQFKRQEEIDLLRSVYGDCFFQVSVYSRRGARVLRLAKAFASSNNEADIQKYRGRAEDIVSCDENERSEEYGQRVAEIFHDADFIVSNDQPTPVHSQVERFCDLVFSSNKHSPTKIEYGLFMAKAAALRSLDLSRQVGAAILTSDGQVVSLGSNEVPMAGGGAYWADTPFDDRDFRRGGDSNDRRKEEILSEILDVAVPKDKALAGRAEIRDSQFMDALEYGRIVHAEMAAITDAARSGKEVAGATLFCTTFPCHMCAKHIVAAGLNGVVFLEPYPKSLAMNLHGDSISVEDNDRGIYGHFPSVKFEHFFGVTPRRYRELFERKKRKSRDGYFLEYSTESGDPTPYFGLAYPAYAEVEPLIVQRLSSTYQQFLESLSIDAKTVGQ